MIHGTGSHTSEDCQKLKAEAKRLKSRQYQTDGKPDYAKSSNKSWNRKALDNKASTKQELSAYVQRKIKAGIQKELASFDKKRKPDTEEGEVEANAFDANNLADFNYEDMRDLKIDSEDDEISV